jgi:hypothetical protein
MMRAALNILFGCLLLAMQAIAALSPHTVSKATPCRCCSCGNQACSTPRTTSAPTPAPLAASRQLSSESEKSSLPVRVAAECAVPGSDYFLLPTTDTSTRPAGQPLYRRFCTLLI